MLDALKSQGFSVDQVTINIASNADNDAQKGQQGSQLGQQMAGNGERNSGTPREQSDARFGTEMDGGTDADGGLGSDDAASAGSVGPRSGQLYL
jgi:chemotaxis protein MotD